MLLTTMKERHGAGSRFHPLRSIGSLFVFALALGCKGPSGAWVAESPSADEKKYAWQEVGAEGSDPTPARKATSAQLNTAW